ncbi:ArnT family glycosyltransferase [Thermoflavifilum thermophilum]|uniref:4-amino-4-deoxy-L-arabinose transferase n=1 Tax=Thermoflavifilum thermophilum TaxID=1393122 RepID=A0A1I7NKI2_9BACT|nr:glycosyltransferase family 39 protein [Thermoflavifilum thermophilum]SFV35086.1 4-amino-4-deoxy-L-arabinose transferase [Thermoflavifilum thermophilum]
MQRRSAAFFWLLLGLSALLLFARLGAESLFQVAEARNAECAREMMTSHNWIVPTFNGILRTDKPPLAYFFMILAYHIFGIHEFAARFFSAVCGLLLVCWTYTFARRHMGQTAAWYAGLALICSVHFIVQCRLATPDPYLMLSHAGAVYAFYEGWIHRKAKWWWLMYTMLALAVLAKGPVGLALPVLTIFLFLLTRRQLRWPVIRLMKPFSGAVIFLCIALPWYILVGIHTQGVWLRDFFFFHNLHRFGSALDAHGGPFILTALFILGGMFPFSLWSFRAMKLAWNKHRESDALWLMMLAFWVILIFYSLSHTKLINYTSPSYPFLAVLLGYYWQEVLQKRANEKYNWIEWVVLALLVVALPIGIYVWARSSPPFTKLPWLAWLFLPALIGGWMGWFHVRKNLQAEALMHIGAGFTLSILLVMLIGYPALDRQTSVRKQASLVAHAPKIVAFQQMNDAFVFYARQNIPVIGQIDSLKNCLQHDSTLWVIRRARDFAMLDSLPQLRLIRKDRDAFSFQYSALYSSKSIDP